MGTTRSYSLSNVAINIGTVTLRDFGRDDAFSWGWTSRLWNRTTGQDGGNVYSRNLERIVQGRISLLGTSRAYTLLYGLLEAQSGDQLGIVPNILLPLPFLLVDAATGDVLSARTCIFMDPPSPSKGQDLGDAVFGVELPNLRFIPGARNLL